MEPRCLLLLLLVSTSGANQHQHQHQHYHDRPHAEGVLKKWLLRARQSPDLATKLLDRGGFACWSTLVQLHLQFPGSVNLIRLSERQKLAALCSLSAPRRHHYPAAAPEHHGEHHGPRRHHQFTKKMAKAFSTKVGVTTTKRPPPQQQQMMMMQRRGRSLLSLPNFLPKGSDITVSPFGRHHNHNRRRHDHHHDSRPHSGHNASSSSSSSSSSSPLAVHHNGGAILNRQHNGLGNQLFQYVFSRLAAESLERPWRTSQLEPARGEAPMSGKGQPPNSDVGWQVFQRLFRHAAHRYLPPHYASSTLRTEQHESNNATGGGGGDGGDGGDGAAAAFMQACSGSDYRDSNKTGRVCRISDRPADLRQYRERVLDQLVGAYFSPRCKAEDSCTYVVAYLQESLYFMPDRLLIPEWFGLPPPRLPPWSPSMIPSPWRHSPSPATTTAASATARHIPPERKEEVAPGRNSSSSLAPPRLSSSSAEATHVRGGVNTTAAVDDPARLLGYCCWPHRNASAGGGDGPVTLRRRRLAAADWLAMVFDEESRHEQFHNHTATVAELSVALKKLRPYQLKEELAKRGPAAFDGVKKDTPKAELMDRLARAIHQERRAARLRGDTTDQQQPKEKERGEQPEAVSSESPRGESPSASSSSSSPPSSSSSPSSWGLSSWGLSSVLPSLPPAPPLSSIPIALRPPPSYPSLEERDLAVHVRCCEPAGMCKWLFMPWGYYEVILDRNAKDNPNSKVWIVTTPQCAAKTLVRSLLGRYSSQARLVELRKKVPTTDAVADDFRFLLNAPRLLLGKSTFGFWAGFLSPVAVEIHMPLDPIALNGKWAMGEKIPFAFDDERYVHHAWEQGQWFGSVRNDAAGNTKFVYAETGHMVSLAATGPE